MNALASAARRALLAVLAWGCAGASPSAHTASAHTASPIHELSWLQGRWETTDARPVGERWERRGGALHGEGYGGGIERSTEVTEYLEIAPGAGGLVYIATALDQERTEFAITELDARHFVAENPAHDFPTRISYERTPAGLHVEVSSPSRSFELDFVRVE